MKQPCCLQEGSYSRAGVPPALEKWRGKTEEKLLFIVHLWFIFIKLTFALLFNDESPLDKKSWEFGKESPTRVE
jgi:hypothetical protein